MLSNELDDMFAAGGGGSGSGGEGDAKRGLGQGQGQGQGLVERDPTLLHAINSAAAPEALAFYLQVLQRVRDSGVGTSLPETDAAGRGWVALARASAILRDVSLCGFFGAEVLRTLNSRTQAMQVRPNGGIAQVRVRLTCWVGLDMTADVLCVAG